MKYILEDQEPKLVWHYFEEICAIPHGSYHTDEISNYLVDFAKSHDLKYNQDELGNVVIYKPATPGHEAAAPLVLQGHMDMVLEKNSDVDIDMEKEGLTLHTEGEYLMAGGTTLGGDDGIAVAMMLAACADDTLVHPALECVITVNEETGMEGANGLDGSLITGRRMLNIDSEAEGILTVGCAGGAEMEFTFPVEKSKKEGRILHLEITGLQGGHSGVEINQGRGNADILMGRLLERIARKAEIRLINIEGGTKDNAIVRESFADVLVSFDADEQAILRQIEKFGKQITKEYEIADPGVKVDYDWKSSDEQVQVLSKKDTKKIIFFLMVVPNGMLETVAGQGNMPQTSLNLGILRTEEEAVKAIFLCRSSINSQKKYLVRRLETVAELFDAKVECNSEYPAWEFKPESDFRSLLENIYEKMNGKKPVLDITHGGLECGLLADKVKGLDCVSVGPDMIGIHTPGEKLSMPSTKRTWEFVVEAMKELAE